MTQENQEKEKKIVIVGGGFAGVRAALDLEKKRLPNTKIILINNKPHFEYHAALYRVVTGKSPIEVCIPLRDVFKGKEVEVVEDTVVSVDAREKKLGGSSGSHYSYDTLVLGLGSETIYFNIPGLEKLSFGFKSINEALTLKNHFHKLFSGFADMTKDEQVAAGHIVVIGGGASGVELAGELASYTKKMALMHAIDSSLITIDLIEAAPRLLPILPEDMSAKAKDQLHSLGVNIFLNRAIVEEDTDGVFLKDMEMKTKTVIWTAGVKPNHLYAEIEGCEYDKKGRVIVDEYLQAKGHEDVFIIGDAALTKYAGMAQTAIDNAQFVARVIANKTAGKKSDLYVPKKPAYAIPVGEGWAAVMIGNRRFYGRIGWWLRRLVDLQFFMSILPAKKAIGAFKSGKSICESCAICNPEYH